MRVKNKVVNGETGEGIEAASIVIVNSMGKRVGSDGTVTDANGNFDFNSSELDNPDRFLIASSQGYDSNIFYPEEWNNTTYPFKLFVNSSSTLGGVIVKAVKKAKTILTPPRPKHTLSYVLFGLSAVSMITWALIKKK